MKLSQLAIGILVSIWTISALVLYALLFGANKAAMNPENAGYQPGSVADPRD
jgi:hypothetical protein